jgi:hypothetical protein
MQTSDNIFPVNLRPLGKLAGKSLSNYLAHRPQAADRGEPPPDHRRRVR